MIGIIGGCHEQQDYEDWLRHNNLEYTVITSKEELRDINFAVFCGGADLEKKPYRDYWEKIAYNECKKLGIPMLCICRGMQLSAMMEGAEIVDIPEELNESHKIDEEKKSRWHKITLTDGREFEVNSRHHQRVFYLPFLYHTMGYDENGIPEYAEENNALLVQCHPEKQEMWETEFDKLVINFIKKFEK